MGSGGSFTKVDSVTTDSTGHITAINLETVNIDSFDNYGSWTLSGDGGQNQVIFGGNTVDIIGGLKIATVSSNTNILTISHDSTTRSDTSSSVSPVAGGTFTVVDSITQDVTGHITATNLKTVTLPPAGGSMTQWLVDDGGAGGFAVQNNDSVTVGSGAKIDLTTSTANKSITWAHTNTNRNDTTSAVTPGSGGTFTVVDSITQDATGHPTAINVKTVTMPTTGGGGGTTYDLTSAQDGNNVDIKLTPSTGAVDIVQLTAGTGVTLADNGFNSVTISASGANSVNETTPGTSSGIPIEVSPTTGNVLVKSMAYAGTNNVGHVPAGGNATTFLRGDGSWQTPSNTQYLAGTGMTLQGNIFNANVSGTLQSVAPQTVTGTSARTYAVQVDASDDLVVNVPWTDTGGGGGGWAPSQGGTFANADIYNVNWNNTGTTARSVVIGNDQMSSDQYAALEVHGRTSVVDPYNRKNTFVGFESGKDYIGAGAGGNTGFGYLRIYIVCIRDLLDTVACIHPR